MKRLGIIFLSVLALCQGRALAQVALGYASCWDQYSYNPRGFWFDGTSAKWYWPLGSGGASGLVTIPGGVPGAAAFAGTDRILVTSYDETLNQTWISELTFTVGATVSCQVQSALLPGLHLKRLCCDPAASWLFGIDTATNSLVVASYQPGLQVGAWSTIATATTSVTLRAVPLAFLKIISRAPGSVTLVSEDLYARPPEHYHQQSGAWNEHTPSIPPPPPPIWQVAPAPNVGSNGYRLWMKGPVGAFRLVESSSGATVYTGVCTGNPDGEWITVPFTALQYGLLYHLKSDAGQPHLDSQPLRVEHYWPRSSMPAEVEASRVAIRWDFPAVGHDFIGWDVHWIASSVPPTGAVLMTIGIGAWDLATDPTVNIAGLNVLATVYGSLTTQSGVWGDSKRLSFGYGFAVNDPVFVGVRIAAQAVGVMASGETIVSDVSGVIFR